MNRKTDINTLNLFLTMQCNRSCIFCTSHSGPNRNEVISLALIKKIAHEVHCWGECVSESPIVRLTGGEPFLYPYLDDVLATFDFVPKIEISTNGMLITDNQLEMMSGQNVSLNLSVYMDDDDKGVVAKPTLKRILESSISTVCVIVSHSQNYKSLPYIFDELESIGAKFIIILGVKPRKESDRQLLLNHDEVISIRRMVEGRNPSDTSYYFKEPPLWKKSRFAGNKVPGCVCGNGQISVLTDGRVVPCNSLVDVVVGNCNDNTLVELYNNRAMQFVRAMSMMSTYDLEPCVHCKSKNICSAGSRINSFLQYGDWLAVEPHVPCSGVISRLTFVDPHLNELHHEVRNM